MSTEAKTPPAKMRRLRPQRSTTSGERARRDFVEALVQYSLLACGIFSIFVTAGIVAVLVVESSAFFRQVSVFEFLGGTTWKPQFEPPAFGVLPLVAGTLVTTTVALAVAIPLGTISAVYLSEFAPVPVREGVKPVLELLSAVPTVVYGYFALLVVTPFMQGILPDLPSFNMLSAGVVMGLMIVPYVSSLSEDAMRSVPMLLREGAYALGANRVRTAFSVVIPSALSGIGAAYILAISRAIGETMIVAVAGGLQPNFTLSPTKSAATMTAFIAQVCGGDLPHDSIGYKAIFAVGLLLFLMTLAFNLAGHLLRRRFHQAY